MVTIHLLQQNDIDQDFLDTLEALRPTHLTVEEAKVVYEFNDIQPLIYIAREHGRIVGTATLLMDRKFIHKGGKVAHIEDVAVHKDHQGKGIGKELIEVIVRDAKEVFECYKVILDCSIDLKSFYEQCGFYESSIQMRLDL